MVLFLSFLVITILVTYYLQKSKKFFHDDDIALRFLAILVSLIILQLKLLHGVVKDTSKFVTEYLVPDENAGPVIAWVMVFVMFSVIFYFIAVFIAVNISKRIPKTVKQTKRRMKIPSKRKGKRNIR